MTTIQLTKKTRDALKKRRLTKRESYEEIIIRLLASTAARTSSVK